MTNNRTRKGFTLIELLVVVLILGILVAIALPAYLSSIQQSRISTANANARSIATEIQALYVQSGGTDYSDVITTGGTFVNLSTATSDMGGALPQNPCTGSTSMAAADATTVGYTVTSQKTGVTIYADISNNCTGSTTPFTLGAGG